MKKIKVLFIVVVLFTVLGMILFSKFNVDVDTDEINQSPYHENATLYSEIASFLFDLFFVDDTEPYEIVERVINYVIVDSIRENINEDYNPFTDCTSDECLYVVSDDSYYLDYIWATLNEDNQIVVHTGIGTSLFDFHTIIHMYFDVFIDYSNFEVVLSLEHLELNDTLIETSLIDRILGDHKNHIEEQVTFGTLNLDDYTYRISFSIFDIIQ